MTTPSGYCCSKPHHTTGGLPQGGVLPSCLWLAFFNGITARLEQKRTSTDQTGAEYTDVASADDITILITTETQAELQAAAKLNVKCLRGILLEMLLQLSILKCQNAVFNPKLLPTCIFRRSEETHYQSTINRLRKQHKAEAEFLVRPLDFDPSEDRTKSEQRQKNTPRPLQA